MPADGMFAVRRNDRDFGTSRWQLCISLHRLREQSEGGSTTFVAPAHGKSGPIRALPPCQLSARCPRITGRKAGISEPNPLRGA
jgi:hypothetical protein